MEMSRIMEISQTDIEKENNFYRKYKTVTENILDIILEFGDENLGGLTSEEITNFIGIRPSSIRRTLANMINKTSTKKYVRRIRKGSFKYFKVCNYDSIEAAKDIISSSYQKETLNQCGFKDSIYNDKLIYNCQVFPNVINTLKKEKNKWLSIFDISKKLGVNTRKGHSQIRGELKRCLKCEGIKFIECKKEDEVYKYRLNYKFRKFTIEQFIVIANSTFPRDKTAKISGVRIQALNELSKMKIGESYAGR
jgi:hypothetical protein